MIPNRARPIGRAASRFLSCVLAGVAAALCLAWAQPSLADPAHGRRLQSLDLDWRFLRSDAAGAEQARFDDRGWRLISLPHTFNARDGERGGAYYRGVAWYRRTLDLAVRPRGQRAYLQFDGAFLVTEVWVNGRAAGRHEGGYAGFRFDITRLLRAGRNVIAVRVDSARRNTVAPLGGDFTAAGGLYRDVRLLWTEELHVDALDYGGPGVYLRTDPVSSEQSRVRVTARVRNDGARPVRAMVVSRIEDARGREVAEAAGEVDLAPGAVAPVVLSIALGRPHLWNGRQDPYLYRVTTRVFRPGAKAPSDTVAVRLGVRSFRMDPSLGFLLNERPYPVHGVDYFHSARPGRGLAVGASEIDEDMTILQRLGVTGLRLVHFQHPQRAYDDADRLGLVVWTEIPLNSAVDDSPEFAANLDEQLRELIRQNYNHPSVVVWGLGNEVYKSDAVSARVLDEVQRTARAEDPTRPTVYADCCHAEDDPQANHTDLIAYNRYFGWYSGEIGEFAGWAARTHGKLPGRAMAVSEYGAGASAAQQEDPPKRPTPASHWHPEQYQALFHESAWRQLRDQRFLWATFAWVGFDVISAGRDEGDRAGINDKGLVTLDRKTFKDAYFWYQANWSDTAMVHVTSPRDTPRTSALVDVKVYANASAVTLWVGGRDLGARPIQDHVAIWPGVRLAPGPNEVEAVGVGRDGAVVRDAVTWTYAPTRPDPGPSPEPPKPGGGAPD